MARPKCDTTLVALEEQLLFFGCTLQYHFVFLDYLLPGLQPGLATSCKKSSESIPDNVLTSEAVTISYIRSCYWTGLDSWGQGRQVHIISSVLPSRSWWLTSSSSSPGLLDLFWMFAKTLREGLIECSESTKNLLLRAAAPLSHSSQSLELRPDLCTSKMWVSE